MKLCLFGAALVALSMMGSGCGTKESAASQQLNLYIWNDYLADDTVANFEKETGIRVAVSNYGSNEELDSKLAPGQSGYDIVVPSASYYERQIKSGYYQRIDKAQVPNLDNLDPEILGRIAVHDPGNEYAVIHMWGTTGIGYNVDKVRAALPDAPTDSWRMVFDPGVAQHFQKCGIAVLDSASEMFGMVLAYRGKTANSQHPEELTAAGDTLMGMTTAGPLHRHAADDRGPRQRRRLRRRRLQRRYPASPQSRDREQDGSADRLFDSERRLPHRGSTVI